MVRREAQFQSPILAERARWSKAVTMPRLADLGTWAADLYATVRLPDKRLANRLIQIVTRLAERPMDSLPQACESWAEVKGAYRFIENRRVSAEALRRPLAEAAARACGAETVVLAIQDTSAFSFPHAYQTEGLGYLNGLDVPGLLVHSVLATREDGLALGLLDVQIWSRPRRERGKKRSRWRRPIEEKESGKWLRGFRAARAVVAANLADGRRPRLIHVGDREEDIYAVFEAIAVASEGAVIRSGQDRRVVGEGGTFDSAHARVRRQPPLATVTLDLPRRRGEAARTATVVVRAAPLTLVPRSARGPQRRHVSLHLLEVWEENPPPGVEPLHWRLWTTEPVATAAQALRVVAIYMKRWKIEEFHLVLKSGCRIEQLRLGNAERLAKTILMYAPVAIRVLQLRDLARLQPEAPCTAVLKDSEWRALWTRIHKRPPSPHTPPPDLRQAILWIGRLGGHLNRKGDGLPGVRTLWRGLRDLELLTGLYELLHAPDPPPG